MPIHFNICAIEIWKFEQMKSQERALYMSQNFTGRMLIAALYKCKILKINQMSIDRGVDKYILVKLIKLSSLG